MSLWDYEREQWNQGIQTVCGVDEAGAGPLAGPVYAAAVILPRELEIPGLNDSKKLTDKKRRELFPLIKEQAIAYGIGLASHEEIDEINTERMAKVLVDEYRNGKLGKFTLEVPEVEA